MTVYVDDMRASFGRMIMCHMIADTEAELHAAADRIGVARRWYQGDHYDIALSKRAMAVAAGAREITWRQCGLMVANRKATGSLGDPETAETVWRGRRSAGR
ncbi:MAG: DUF4031 domain-containing protein [Alphaproteobacteria bacterium]|nr:DUF4031 domain-containing protein [Alphaproteobacteria bacterium]